MRLLACLVVVLVASPGLAQPVVLEVEATSAFEVAVTFDVAIDPVTGGEVGNYRVSERDGPVVVPIGSIAVAGARATLTLAGALGPIAYTLLSHDVQPFGGGPGSPLTATEFQGPVADLEPPQVVGASPVDPASVAVEFSEVIDSVTGGMPSNYQIFETDDPASTLSVIAVAVSDARATLTLEPEITANVSYTVQVSRVEDPAGNVVDPDADSATFLWAVLPVKPIEDPPKNLLSLVGQHVCSPSAGSRLGVRPGAHP